MEFTSLVLFVVAALAIAVSPGPGLFYVAARTLAGGRAEGLASSFGTGLGGLVHVAAGAVGVSALVMASAEAFSILKIVGAFYLMWLGLKAWREAGLSIEAKATATGSMRAFREGIIVEALNPKTAAFFLAFLPQFVEPSAGPIWLQFLLLGLVSVAFNTVADIAVALLASHARSAATARPHLLRRLRQGSGLAIASLGLSLFFARRPAAP